MKKVISFIFLAFFVSCAQVSTPSRNVASNNCYESVKTEYHSYFDSYEKCIEKPQPK
jgi:hypothetical protein